MPSPTAGSRGHGCRRNSDIFTKEIDNAAAKADLTVAKEIGFQGPKEC